MANIIYIYIYIVDSTSSNFWNSKVLGFVCPLGLRDGMRPYRQAYLSYMDLPSWDQAFRLLDPYYFQQIFSK